MPTPDNPSPPVAVKMLYVKLIFLTDKEEHEKSPVFKQTLRRSGQEFAVYDSAIYYQFTQFGENRPDDHEWKFTSSEGFVDGIQWHPFAPQPYLADPARRTIEKGIEGYLRPTPDTLVVVSHFYNGFQRGHGEWAGVRAANDTGLLRIVLDFSSVMTAPDKELFIEEPRAFVRDALATDAATAETPINLEFSDGRTFSACQRDVRKKDVLKLSYRLNWNALVSWRATDRETTFTPNVIL